jgi:hypothetical protein
MEIEINGLKYQLKEQNKTQITRFSRVSTMLIGRAMMFGGQGNVGTSRKQRERPKVNLVSEFELIQNKKSKLSKNDRDWVEFQFHRNFKLIPN